MIKQRQTENGNGREPFDKLRAGEHEQEVEGRDGEEEE
jgi:hypothetical protein